MAGLAPRHRRHITIGQEQAFAPQRFTNSSARRSGLVVKASADLVSSSLGVFRQRDGPVFAKDQVLDQPAPVGALGL